MEGGEGAHNGRPYGAGGGFMVALAPALSHGERELDCGASRNDEHLGAMNRAPTRDSE